MLGTTLEMDLGGSPDPGTVAVRSDDRAWPFADPATWCLAPTPAGALADVADVVAASGHDGVVEFERFPFVIRCRGLGWSAAFCTLTGEWRTNRAGRRVILGAPMLLQGVDSMAAVEARTAMLCALPDGWSPGAGAPSTHYATRAHRVADVLLGWQLRALRSVVCPVRVSPVALSECDEWGRYISAIELACSYRGEAIAMHEEADGLWAVDASGDCESVTEALLPEYIERWCRRVRRMMRGQVVRPLML